MIPFPLEVLVCFFLAGATTAPVWAKEGGEISSEEISIQEFAVSTAVVNRMPCSPLGSEIELPVRQLFFWTQVHAKKPPMTISHGWSYKEQEVAEVPLGIKSSSYRTWSKINSVWPGYWTVVAKNGKTILKEIRFLAYWSVKAEDRPYALRIEAPPLYSPPTYLLFGSHPEGKAQGTFALSGNLIFPKDAGIAKFCPSLEQIAVENDKDGYRWDGQSASNPTGIYGQKAWNCLKQNALLGGWSRGDSKYQSVTLPLNGLPRGSSPLRLSFSAHLWREVEKESRSAPLQEGADLSFSNEVRLGLKDLAISTGTIILKLRLDSKDVFDPLVQVKFRIEDFGGTWLEPSTLEAYGDQKNNLSSGNITLAFRRMDVGGPPRRIKATLYDEKGEDAVFVIKDFPNPVGLLR